MDVFSQEHPFTAAHCRAARRLLGWSAEELAKRSGLGISTVRNFESGHRPRLQKRTVRDILAGLKDGGIEWRTEEPGDPSIKCADGVVAVLKSSKGANG